MKLAEWFKENPKVFSEWDAEANTHISLDEVGHTSKEKVLYGLHKLVGVGAYDDPLHN